MYLLRLPAQSSPTVVGHCWFEGDALPPRETISDSLSLSVWVLCADLRPFLICELAKGRAWIVCFLHLVPSLEPAQMFDGYKNG